MWDYPSRKWNSNYKMFGKEIFQWIGSVHFKWVYSGLLCFHRNSLVSDPLLNPSDPSLDSFSWKSITVGWKGLNFSENNTVSRIFYLIPMLANEAYNLKWEVLGKRPRFVACRARDCGGGGGRRRDPDDCDEDRRTRRSLQSLVTPAVSSHPVTAHLLQRDLTPENC